jgi:dTDP-4-amino-4,6-dideoxygalactose transaminase
MNVPSLDLRAQYRSIKDAVDRKVLEVIANQGFILGPEVEGLEKDVAAYSGARFAVGVSSGSDAQILSLMALGIGRGDAVLTTPFTFFATAGAIARLGARPVFCDIDEATCNIDPERLEAVLADPARFAPGASIKAVVPVHLYGQCADMVRILESAGRRGLPVIEDACQAIGTDYPSARGVKKAGAIGLCGFFSFYPTKNLGGFGDGGMVLTDDEALAAKLRKLRVHGERERYYYDELGGNFRLDAIQAAVLRVKLSYLDGWQEARRAKAAVYDRAFEEAGLTADGAVRIPRAVYRASGAANFHTYHQYVIRARKRDELKEFLRAKGVGTMIYYPLPLHLQKCFAGLGYKAGDFPQAERAAAEVLALPMYPELSREQQDYVVSAVREFYRRTP